MAVLSNSKGICVKQADARGGPPRLLTLGMMCQAPQAGSSI
jgi:hypothetical protein